ncbi:phosphoglycolate phosphatase [Neptunomonas sp.]|uniref:phosphoglycolate phosphatase n=1 Tax=Neptunomonas sp. TaxID=1971898 RepID=UPI0025D19FBC|nr:phosphoglycolate phosphatase [Neptunomonas sp.]
MLIKTLFNGHLPRLVIFDLDGTLVDSVPDLSLAVDRALLALGLSEVGEANVRLWVGNGAQVLIERALRHVLLEVPEKVFDQAYLLFLKEYECCLASRSRLYPGVLETLTLLKEMKIPMAVVTNKPIAFTHPVLRGLGVDSYFASVLGGDSLPAKKPDPLPLNTLIQEYNLSASQVLMVGDSMSDVSAARSAECPVVAVSYGYNHGVNIMESCPDKVINSLLKLLE